MAMGYVLICIFCDRMWPVFHRERDLSSKVIIHMDGNKTSIFSVKVSPPFIRHFKHQGFFVKSYFSCTSSLWASPICYSTARLVDVCIINAGTLQLNAANVVVHSDPIQNSFILSSQDILMNTSEEKTKSFTYDFSYDSSNAKKPNFATQDKVQRNFILKKEKLFIMLI